MLLNISFLTYTLAWASLKGTHSFRQDICGMAPSAKSASMDHLNSHWCCVTQLGQTPLRRTAVPRSACMPTCSLVAMLPCRGSLPLLQCPEGFMWAILLVPQPLQCAARQLKYLLSRPVPSCHSVGLLRDELL